ncbi:zinc finger protein 431-like [Nycticebus coucang]|uniref:zinc finger protein 431-like n=1 Tax=Nycticebus coucang TaxID=9470 RepID=UPI00234D7731|nr:zinc finger protein 431-like [Nycticebus coucang]
MNQPLCAMQYMKTQYPEILYTCKNCKKVFQQCLKLINHDDIHNEEYSYKCTEWIEAFLQSEEASKIREVDIGEDSYRNNKCENVFNQSTNLRNNIIRSEEKPYKCKQHGVSFTLSPKLGKHHVFHTGEKPYKWKECGKVFKQRSTLREHQRIHTGEKPFRCDEYGKAFTQCSALMIHETIHTRKKTYKCKEYGKSFNVHSDFMIHKNS